MTQQTPKSVFFRFHLKKKKKLSGISISLILISRARWSIARISLLHAGGDLLYDGDVAVTSRPDSVRVLMAEALRHALAGPQRRVELRMTVVVGGLVHPLDIVPLAHAVLDDVQGHVEGLRLGQPGPRRRRARARRRRRDDAVAEAREPRPRQERRRRLPSPADQEEQRRAAQGTQRARVVAHPRTVRVHVTCGRKRERGWGKDGRKPGCD